LQTEKFHQDLFGKDPNKKVGFFQATEVYQETTTVVTGNEKPSHFFDPPKNTLLMDKILQHLGWLKPYK